MEQKTVICVACYFKGYDFMDEMKRLGNRVILITAENLRHRDWPWHAIDEVFYMQEVRPSVWNLNDLVLGFAHFMHHEKADAIVALDDYDVEKAALLREVFRIPGMGQTTQRYFRDKLAMRMQAKEHGIGIPEFTPIFNDDAVNNFVKCTSAPWVLKPRSEASSSGIRKIKSVEEVWPAIHSLGEERHLFLLECFKPGDVFHADSLIFDKKTVFTSVSQYLAPPMEVSQQGGVFRTKTLNRKTSEFKDIEKLNAKVLKSFGLKFGAAHTEFIRDRETGEWYFLETSCRVGGAHIPDMVEAACGVNLWREWAKIENAVLHGEKYKIAKPKESPAALLVALSKEQYPDQELFRETDAVKFLPIEYHVGIIFKSKNDEDLQESLDAATKIVSEVYLTTAPAK